MPEKPDSNDLEQVVLDKRDESPYEIVVGLYAAAPSASKVTPFTIGQIVGEPIPTVDDVQIRIDAINEDRSIVAAVVKLGDFYSTKRPGMEDGFILGETLLLQPHETSDGTIWNIKEPSGRPWHVLGCRDKGPFFEHYR